MSEHTDKYDALIENMGGLDVVAQFMPCSINEVKTALSKGDEHLNTISLARWDAIATGWCDIWPVHTLAERVCLLKRAAARLARK